jgi:hypothetical protein
MLKPFLLVALFLCCCARGLSAQEPCRIGRAAAPDYGGVMLGMRPEELARMFPGSEDLRAGPGAGDGSKPFVASLGMLDLGVRKEEFEGVEELALTFIGGTLHRSDVVFRQPTPWKSSVTSFSEQVSRQLVLPLDSWGRPASDAEKQSRVLDCQGFSVVLRIDRGGASTLSIVDTTADGADRKPEPSATPAKRPPRKRGVR